MIALIDGDILIYRVGFTTEQELEQIARYRLEEMFYGILNECRTDRYKVYLSDSENNWRKSLFPEYKANRKQPKPRHLDFLCNLLLEEYNAIVAWGEEADDALGIEQTKAYSEKRPEQDLTVIVSIDKDLKQIEGRHYNFVKKEWDDVTRRRGLYNFYYQCLVGDAVDNIQGCRTIGHARASKALNVDQDEAELFDTVLRLYEEHHNERAKSDLLLAGQLLKIRTYENELWQFPIKEST